MLNAQNSQKVTDMGALTLPYLTRMEECVALDSEELSGTDLKDLMGY